MREVIYYSSRSKSEPLSIFPSVEKVVKARGRLITEFRAPEASVPAQATSYSSVHVVLEATLREQPASQAFSAC
ncbi:MAG TPA: hypothetical protein VFB22_07700 [Candidatus Baltobacteraceae bacterium]|nr:hypothetical protein [Candidatus Baltobacteraceae bacterium]